MEKINKISSKEEYEKLMSEVKKLVALDPLKGSYNAKKLLKIVDSIQEYEKNLLQEMRK